MTCETTEGPDDAPPAFGEVEASLLADAFGVDPSQIIARTREPLGAGSVAGFDVGADGERLRYYVDTSRSPVPSETGLALGDPASPDARVWLHPADPHLPALAPAAFGHAAAALLARLGIGAVDTPALVAYRPGRRAVVRVTTTEGAAWIKIVRPSRVQRIVETHTRLGGGGVPVPEVRGWASEGLIVIDDAHGVAAQHVRWDPDRLLDSVDGLRATLAETRLGVSVQGAATRLPWYASRLTPSDGEIERRAASLIARLQAELSSLVPVEATVHGDLHFGQLFLDAGDAIAAVIDVDTAGRGDPAEDTAAFIAHAAASALITSTDEGRERVWQLADSAYARWGDDPATRLLAAVHLVGHAIGAMDRGESVMTQVLTSIAAAVADRAAPSSARPKSGLTHTLETA